MGREKKVPIISGRVKELRIEEGLTQEKFAESIGVAANTISRIEREEMSLSSEIALRIAENYTVSLDWLFYHSEVKTPFKCWKKLQEAFDCMKEHEIVE